MVQEKIKEYSRVGISTSNQEVLIIKCYDGTISSIKQAIELIPDRKNWPEADTLLTKAQSGVALLADSVNRNAGEVAANLVRLYDFMIRALVKASTNKDVKMLEEVVTMLTDLKESWQKAFEKLHQEEGQSFITKMNSAPKLSSTLNIIG